MGSVFDHTFNNLVNRLKAFQEVTINSDAENEITIIKQQTHTLIESLDDVRNIFHTKTKFIEKQNLIFHQITKNTSTAKGSDYPQALVKELSQALDVQYALVALHMKPIGERAQVISMWAGDDYVSPFEYFLKGTPCEDVYEKEYSFYTHDIQKHFPKDKMLVEMGAQSYLGVPLIDYNDQTIGHLSIVDTEPMNDDIELAKIILYIFASRVIAELERSQYETQMVYANKQLIKSLETLKTETKEKTKLFNEFNLKAYNTVDHLINLSLDLLKIPATNEQKNIAEAIRKTADNLLYAINDFSNFFKKR